MALDVSGASHRYGEAQVLLDVSLTVGQGEIYSLLGPNGAGKSTLLRAIAGRLMLDQGAVRIAGELSAQQAASDQLIGYVPQDIALYSHLTVRENLSFFSRLFGLSRIKARDAIARTLSLAALEDRAHQITGTLSGGYQRRVNIAVAALNNPYLLVLDEPTVGIDVQAREAIHELLRVLQEAGAAIILTTHDLEQAQYLSDRIGILQGGRMLLEGAPDALIRNVFGDNREMIVVLQVPAGPREENLLRTLQFEPGQQATLWTMVVSPDQLDVAGFTRFLASQGVQVQEVRIRKPDLTSLFLTTIGAPP